MKTFNPDSIKIIRLTNGLTQEVFAEKLGDTIQKQHISNWENSVNIPDTKSLLLIVNAFNVPFEIFFTEQMHHSNKEAAK